MNQKILNRLCCPLCKSALVANPFVEESIQCSARFDYCAKNSGSTSVEKIIKDGVLLCQACNVWYPIYSYIPVMLVFETDFHRMFVKQYASEFRKFSEYTSPSGLPQPGEKSIQETFTDEWDCLQNDELSFLYSQEDLKVLCERVWLKWIQHSREKIQNVLNVGCGLGHESIALQEVTEDAEVFAVDLNFALLKAGESFKSNSKIHLVIASLFRLPFEQSSFDLVYSNGVIHHTFSTAEAFKSIAAYVRRDRFIFVWVYGLDDHLLRTGVLGLVAQMNYLMEKVARPMISGSPRVIRDIFFVTAALILHPLIRSRVRHKATWKLKNTEHDLRDWLSPRYAYRHSYNEVFEWFENLGFEVSDVHSPAAFRRLVHKQLWGVGLTGRRM